MRVYSSMDKISPTMNYQKLKKHITALATLPETDSPVLSAYFDLQTPRQEFLDELRSWSIIARQTFRGQQRQDFEDALEEVVEFVDRAHFDRSAAIFCRWGEYPLCLPLTFNVPLETQFHAKSLPVIYPLVELKDRFNRFVLVLTTSEAAQIFEINLGEVSERLLAERPDLRKRLGREWTRDHYQNHRRHREEQFLKEKVGIIERLMAKRGHNALILAGEPRFVSRLRDALPKHLQARIAGELRSGTQDSDVPEVIEKAIQSFVEQESRESHDAVRRLDEAVRGGGLAVLGIEPTRAALQAGQGDLLILSSTLPESDRETLVREAARTDTSLETVQDSELLEQNGGVGCLLRYLSPVPPAAKVA